MKKLVSMSKPKFNPNQKFEVAQDEKPKFDPDAEFESMDEPKTSAFDAFHKNASDTATLGYGPQIRAGVIDPIVEKVGNFITGDNVDMGDYLTNRDAYRKEIETSKQEHPDAALAGTLTGAAATSLMPGLGAAKGATALGRIANAGIAGGVIGAVANPGDTEGEYSGLQLKDRGLNTVKGAVAGSVLQGMGEGVAKGIQKGGEYFKRLGQEKAVKAVGAMKKDFKNLGEDKVNELGRQLLDDEIVTPLSRPKEIAERLNKKIGETSSDLQGQLSKADEVFNRPEGFNMENATTEQINAFNRGQLSTKQIRDGLIDDLRKSYQGVPEEELAPAIAKVDTWLKDKPEYMSVSELQQLKTGLNNFLKKSDFYSPQPSIAKEGLLSVRRGAKEAIENKANAAADIMGEAGGGIKATNKKLGNYLEAQDLVDDAIGRDAANRSISLTDTIWGAAGGTVGGIPGAIASTAANKVGRMYGNSVMATGFDKISKMLLQSPRFAEMAKTNPKAFNTMVQSLANNPKFQEAPEGSTDPATPLLDRMSADPTKMDVLQNDRLKEQLKKSMRQRNMNAQVPVEHAQASFIQGN